jgi:ankyrin repeat protein
MLMLINDVEKDSLIHMKDNYGNTALHIACGKHWSDKLIPFLLAHGARKSVTNLQGETPLHIAARCRVHTSITLLVDAGANTHTQDIHGRTPVHSLIVADRLTLLLEMPNKRNDVFNMMAVLMYKWDHQRTLSYLEIKDKEGNTPLMSACKMKNVIIIDGLIQIEGININAVDNNGTTIIHECVRSGLEITKDLINKGVDIYVINHSLQTPLDLAKQLQPLHVRDEFVRWIRGRIEYDKSLMLAFSMSQHKRLGDVSKARTLAPETLEIIQKQRDHSLY